MLHHDWVTLYANGIRYLEKAPLLYWSMAASFKLFGPDTAAARLPLAFTVLALALAVEAFARRAFSIPEQHRSGTRAGLYAGIILLSSFGIFIFTRITIPDAMVCLWLTLAILCYWLTESQPQPDTPLPVTASQPHAPSESSPRDSSASSSPSRIVALHLLLTRGIRGVILRILHCHPITSTAVFLAIAAPWHILIGLANPTQGNPGSLTFSHGHWNVPLPTDGNVHGWFWFYFINEHVLRYLNLRVPRDYDTVPLLLFWGLLLVWLMPWSAFVFHAVMSIKARAALAASPLFARWKWLRTRLNPDNQSIHLSAEENTRLLLGIWGAVPLLFFSLSTRQEYYVLPALPALILLIAAWLNDEASEAESFTVPNPLVTSGQRIAVVMLVLGSIAALAAGFFVIHSQPPGPNIDLASMLKQNPGDYALSFGHFLDLNAQAMGAFRIPLILTVIALFGGTLGSWLLRRDYRPHAANLCTGRRSLPVPARRTPRPADLLTRPHLKAARRRHRAPDQARRHHRHPRRVRGRQHPRLLPAPGRHPHLRGPQLESLVRQLLPRRAAYLRRQFLALTQMDRRHPPRLPLARPGRPTAQAPRQDLLHRPERRQGDSQQST